MRNIYRLSLIRKLVLFVVFFVCCWINLAFFKGHLNEKQKLDKTPFEDNRICKTSVGFSNPVDIVYTWVNGTDQILIDTMLRYLPADTEITAKRFRDWGTLRYSLRSVEKYADWINHVYIVTNGQVPDWLNTGYHKVSIVTHAEIFRNLSHLPTFNAQAIECHIHRIPGLSKSFLYMNDDFFFGQTINLEDFYTKETGIKIRFGAGKLHEYSSQCHQLNADRDTVQKLCNNSECEWNGEYCLTAEHKKFNLVSRYGSFFGSLVYTSLAYDKVFGHTQRGVPAHAPYITDVDTMAALQERFPQDWERTSVNRFRVPHCFQYSFAYYHFLMNFQQILCRQNTTQPVATVITDNTDYAYLATGNSTTLDRILTNFLHKKHKKFVCINDHMSNKVNEEEVARNGDVITKFFEAYFPEPSKFEIK